MPAYKKNKKQKNRYFAQILYTILSKPKEIKTRLSLVTLHI